LKVASKAVKNVFMRVAHHAGRQALQFRTELTGEFDLLGGPERVLAASGTSRAARMNSTKGPSLAGRERLAGTFSVADILMADVLRLADRFDGPGGQSRLPRLRRARHGPASLRQGPRRPDGAFRRGGLSPAHEPTVASDPGEVCNGS
jgi:glutathione S-transferase